jgi:hypothetical protein
MNYPKFFDEVENIVLKDELSDFLGTFNNGEIKFSYLDIVKQAGHSCPTVAGAYLMVLEGLKALYPNEIPQRGEIEVEFREELEDGVAGVIANVVTHITGATDTSGFKGIGGNFVRHSLMSFNNQIDSNLRFTRKDNGNSIEVIYDLSNIPSNPKMGMLMNKIMDGDASMEDKIAFRELWQDRVEKILNSTAQVITIR